MIHQAIPQNAVADWDSTINVRYGKQEDAAAGYNPQKPGRPSHHPQGAFWKPCVEDFGAYVSNLTPEEAAAFQIVELYRQRAEAENVFDELKNQWGISGFCSRKAAVSQSSARMLLLVYNLWSIFVRVLKNQAGHTEAIKSRYGLLLIPAKMVLSGRRQIVKLAVGKRFADFLKQAYRRLEEWLSQTAPQLSLAMENPPPWLPFVPPQTDQATAA